MNTIHKAWLIRLSFISLLISASSSFAQGMPAGMGGMDFAELEKQAAKLERCMSEITEESVQALQQEASAFERELA